MWLTQGISEKRGRRLKTPDGMGVRASWLDTPGVFRDVLRASVMLPERSDKQQQQQLSRKVSAGQAVSREEKRALREQRVSGVPGPFSSLQSLPPAFVMCSKWSAYYLERCGDHASQQRTHNRCRLHVKWPPAALESRPVGWETRARPASWAQLGVGAVLNLLCSFTQLPTSLNTICAKMSPLDTAT